MYICDVVTEEIESAVLATRNDNINFLLTRQMSQMSTDTVLRTQNILANIFRNFSVLREKEEGEEEIFSFHRIKIDSKFLII